MTCPRCQRPLPYGHVAGNCPACLLDSALRDEPPLEEGEQSELPSTVGEYEILAEIGRGGTSVVYRAMQRSVNRVVALKVLHGSALLRREAFERLRIEAHAVARLDHPHIVPLYEIGRDAGLHFLSLRHFERGSLAQALARRRFTPQQSAQLISVAARAVHHAHQRGVLHRDIKPSNLLLDDLDQPHLTDFGLAKLADGDSSLTLSTSVLGTPAYMAPEQASGSTKEASVPADLYSLGSILFELLTGRPPFVGRTSIEVLRQVADIEPPPPRSLNKELDVDMEAICLHCLEKEPSRRYSTAAELADDLDRWLAHEPVSIRPATTVVRLVKWSRRRPLVASLIALVVLALLGGIVGTTWQWRIARRTADMANLNAYVADMGLVQRIYASEPGRARHILDRYRPKPGQTDWRGWEWRYFWQGCRGEKPEHSWRSTNAIFSLVATPDGKNIVTGEIGGGMRIFNSRTVSQIYQPPDEANRDLAPYMPSGNRVGARVEIIPGTSLVAWSETTGVTNCVIQFLDVSTKQNVRSLPQPYTVRNMAATPDGTRLVVSYQTPHGETWVWDLANGTVLTRIPKGPGWSNFTLGNPLAISPDGRLMTFDEFPDHLRIIRLETGEDLLRIPLDDQYGLSAAFSPDGKTVAVYGGFNKGSAIQLWDVATGRHQGTLNCEAGWLEQILYSRDGKMIVSASTDQTIRFWDTATMRLLRVIRWNEGAVMAMSFSADGSHLYTSSSDGILASWDLERKPRSKTEGRLPGEFYHNWHFLPDSKGMVGTATNGVALQISGASWDDVEELRQLGTNCSAVDVAGDLSSYVAGYDDGRVQLRRAADGKVEREFGSFDSQVRYIQVFRRSGKVLAMNGSLARVWDLTDGKLRCEFSRGEVYPDVTADESAITTVSFAGDALTVDLATGHRTIRHLSSPGASGFAYSPSGRLAAMCGSSIVPQLYEVEGLKSLGPLGEEAVGGFALAFSPDGHRVAIGRGGMNAVQLYDVTSRGYICSLPADIDLPESVIFSPDGNVIGESASVLSAVYFWWAPSWEEIARVEAAGEY